jgi:uncharacterized membrane protein
MALTPTGSGRLQVLQAVEEGWAAFCRAPWAFLLFEVLAGAILLPFLALVGVGAGRLGEVPELLGVHPTGAWLALIVGLIGYLIVLLWALVGLTRAAWLALGGQKPAFADFIRWDPAPALRLLGSALLLAIVVALAGAVASLLGLGLGRINQALGAIPVVVVGIFYLWLAITQKFLVQVSLLGTSQPLDTLRSGINVVNPSWGMVLWLAVVEAVLQMIAALFSYGGLLVVWPLLICISTAAYRQLFGADDRTGLLN